jgi:hypothetical protein
MQSSEQDGHDEPIDRPSSQIQLGSQEQESSKGPGIEQHSYDFWDVLAGGKTAIPP